MSGRACVLGDVVVDLTLTVDRFPREGGDAFARGRRTDVGGCGANIGIMLTRLGLRASVIANVGDDEWGHMGATVLARQGVDIEALSLDPSASTHLTVIVLSNGGERTMVGHRGASARAGPWVSACHAVGRSDVLVVSGYALLGDERATQARRGQLTTDVAAWFAHSARPSDYG